MAYEVLSGKTADKTTVGEFLQKIDLQCGGSFTCSSMRWSGPLRNSKASWTPTCQPPIGVKSY